MDSSNYVSSGFFKMPCLIAIGIFLLMIPDASLAVDLELKDWKRLKYEAITEDPIDVLRMIAEKSEANYQNIKTWSAAFRFQDKAAHPKIEEVLAKALSKAANRDLDGATVYSTTSGTIEFEIDMAKESFYSSKAGERCVFTDLQTGEVLADLNQERDSLPIDEESKIAVLHTLNVIITPEHCIHMEPDKDYPRFALAPDAGPKSGRAVFRDSREKGLRLSTVVDPRELFGEGMPHWEMARNVAMILEVLASDQPPKEKGWQELLKANPTVTVKQAKTDDGPIYWVRLEMRTLKTGIMRTDYRFDGRAGFNMVQSRTTGPLGEVVSDMEWSYIKSNDVFVPKSWIKMMSDPKTGKLAYQRNLDFKSCKINGPLHPDGFGYKRLGLKDGERVVDRIKQAVYVLDGKDLKPVDEEK